MHSEEVAVEERAEDGEDEEGLEENTSGTENTQLTHGRDGMTRREWKERDVGLKLFTNAPVIVSRFGRALVPRF